MLQQTCPDLSSSQKHSLGKETEQGVKRFTHVLTKHKPATKEKAEVIFFFSNEGLAEQKKEQRVEFLSEVVICEPEDRYAGKDGIRASLTEELSQHWSIYIELLIRRI